MSCFMTEATHARSNSFGSAHHSCSSHSNHDEAEVTDIDYDPVEGTTFQTPGTIKRSQTEEISLCQKMDSWQIDSHPNTTSRSHSHSSSLPEQKTRLSRVGLRLPSFSSLRINSEALELLHDPNILSTQSPTGMTPLLTPPPDDLGPVFSRSPAVQRHQRNYMSGPVQSDGDSAHPDMVLRNQLGLNLSQPPSLSEQSSMQHHGWVEKSAETILSCLSAATPTDQLQVVSQTLPSQAKDSRTEPTFEAILEKVQLGLDHAPFITITHAVPQARTMDEVPKTPPSTPRPTQTSTDYFTDDQTIFTHAAVVPIYHNHGPVSTEPERIPRSISAPTVQISILERYIPPTTQQEASDFFSKLSNRSYLSDRLSELSSQHGSLLLVYPTKTGGKTFMQQYLSPVFDPFLRQFVLLNNLTSDIAAALGTMTGTDGMLEFDDMSTKLERFCRALTQGPLMRGQRSHFQISYSEKTEVTLDRRTWINWFVEQEQSRLRQNLIDYHNSGARMPEYRGTKEVTVSMLTREVIEGIQKSKADAGGVGIEVGVFVVTRSRAS